MLVEITGLDDRRLVEYTSLKDVTLRRRLEPQRGLYIAESRNVIERALAAGHQPISVLTLREWLPELDKLLCKRLGYGVEGSLPIYIGSATDLEALTGFKVHRGALAAFQRPQLEDVEELLRRVDAHRVCVLEDLVDHTNVGATFRSAAALGIDAVLVTPRCADPLYRRAVRVSMGTVFQVPWTRLRKWPATEMLREAGFTTLALALDDRAVSLDELETSPLVSDPKARIAVIMGTEGDGLGRRTVSSADQVVRIPMGHGVDSLNVASAAAVTFWAIRSRQWTASGRS